MGHSSQLMKVFTLDPYLPEFSFVEVKVGQRSLQCGPQGCECAGTLSPSVRSTKVSVKFLSKNFGSFNQRLVFDFGVWPKLVRHLGVVVAPEQDLVQHLKLPAVHEKDSELVWLSKHQLIPLDPLQGIFFYECLNVCMTTFLAQLGFLQGVGTHVLVKSLTAFIFLSV